MNLRKLCFVFFLLAIIYPTVGRAQVGYNPEFLGNAAAAPRPGFSPKIFFDYFNQNSIRGNDVEIAFEPQYWIRGFTGEKKNDYIQFLVHVPMGYRTKKDSPSRDTGWGFGNINVNVEHFWKLADSEDVVWWFDNGLSAGLPTGMGNEIRMGGNSYAGTWFQENFIKYDNWVFSISPISVTYTFKDRHNDTTPGLSLNIMNSAYGYQVTKNIALGVTTALQIVNVLNSHDVGGNKIHQSRRLYVGPAGLFVFKHDQSLQVSGLIDVYTKNATRGQGVAMAYWKMF